MIFFVIYMVTSKLVCINYQCDFILFCYQMIGVSSTSSVFTTPFPAVESIRDGMIEPSSYDPYDMGKLQLQVGGSIEAVGGNWTPPAKMRITRKASADPGASGMEAKKPRRRAQAYEHMSSQPNLGVIRVCSDCNTTKTPLWRSGPCGPKVGLIRCLPLETQGPCTFVLLFKR
jgi:hypothetical protein